MKAQPAIFALTFALIASVATAQTVSIDTDDIGGIVTGPNGPEAGVWVIAETTDLPTRFVRIVVTDDQGRYLLPDLPAASYKVWVRTWLLETGKGTVGKVLRFQLRPDPLAK